MNLNDFLLILTLKQRLVVNEASRAQSSAREGIRAAASSGKIFRNCISKLNSLAKENTFRQGQINLTNSVGVISLKTNIKK